MVILGVCLDDSANTYIPYLNGVAQSTNSGASQSATIAATTMSFGGSYANAGFTDSSMDEIRYSAINRSAGWITTEYNNQKSPGTFYSVGTQQNSGSGTVPITVTSAPSALSLTVDSSACTAPCNFQWTQGSSHTIAVTTTPQAGATGTQYVYGSWSDGLARTPWFTVPDPAAPST